MYGVVRHFKKLKETPRMVIYVTIDKAAGIMKDLSNLKNNTFFALHFTILHNFSGHL